MSSSSEVKRVQKKNNRHGTPGTLGRSALSTLNNESTTTTNNNNTKSPHFRSTNNNNNAKINDNVGKATNVQVCVRLRPLLESDFNNKNNNNSCNATVAGNNNNATNTPRKSGGMKRHTSGLATPSTTTIGSNRIRNSSIKKPSTTTAATSNKKNSNTEQQQQQQSPCWTTHPSNTQRITQSSNIQRITQSIHTLDNMERTRYEAADYNFDRVYSSNESTNVLYCESIKNVVNSVVDGFHGSVFAYGQTNSGKTHTMTGSPSESGVVRLAVQDIFHRIRTQQTSTHNNNSCREYLVRVSYLEIYNEQIYDLLALPQPRGSPSRFKTSLQHHHLPPSTAVRIFESRTEGVVVRGLREEIVTCPEDVFALLDSGDAKRRVGSTGMNKTSSRSHSVFRLVLESRASKSSSNPGVPLLIPSSNSSINSDTDSVATGRSSITQSLGTAVKGPVRISSLSLVDLAGSESVKATNNTGVRQKEGQYINKSLLTLGHVVHKLSEMSKNNNSSSSSGGLIPPSEHIPYRDSKLTRLLQPSLGGNAQVCIICNISPALSNLEESHNTLKFAMRAKKIQQHARITEVADEKTLLRSYREEIEELKRQLKEARKSSAVTTDVQQQSAGVQVAVHQTPRVERMLVDDSESSDEEDQDDTHVLVSAIANLESLILKAGASKSKLANNNDGNSTVASTVEGDGSSLPSRRSLDAALIKAESDGNDAKSQAFSLSVKTPLATPTVYDQQQSTEEDAAAADDHLLEELHRIRGMLGTAMVKKRNKGGGSNSASKKTSNRTPERDAEVEQLRMQLQSQEVASTMRKADSSFLQSQLNEKEGILKEVSVLLEALEKRQIELERENKQLKEDLTGAIRLIEEGDNARKILEKQLTEKEEQLAEKKDIVFVEHEHSK